MKRLKLFMIRRTTLKLKKSRKKSKKKKLKKNKKKKLKIMKKIKIKKKTQRKNNKMEMNMPFTICMNLSYMSLVQMKKILIFPKNTNMKIIQKHGILLNLNMNLYKVRVLKELSLKSTNRQ